MKSSDKEYSLRVSNLLFELWLLMHFELITVKMHKRAIYQHLSSYLNSPYKKADPGIIREIINKGNIEEAIDNAKKLANSYSAVGKRIDSNINKMNPYTNIYILIKSMTAMNTQSMGNNF